MNLKLELSSDAPGHWTPDKAACSRWVKQALDAARFPGPCQVSIRFAGEAESAALNRRYRGKAEAGDVLSFPCAPAVANQEMPDSATATAAALGYRPLGDILLCPTIIERQAKRRGRALEAHWAHLTVHGTLHLIGHDHQQDADAAAMEAIEVESLARLGYPNPYSSVWR